MNKVIVFTNPVAPFQRIILIKNGETSEVGVGVSDLADAVLESAEKHQIEEIEFRGNQEYCLGLMHELCNHSHYTNTIKVKYIGG